MSISQYRSKSVPAYLNGVGQRVQKILADGEKARLDKSLSDAKRTGRMTTAQFTAAHPNVIDHGQGNYEDSSTGEIWESRSDGFIHRRPDESIAPVLTAINSNPDMTDEEYEQLIADFNGKKTTGE